MMAPALLSSLFEVFLLLLAGSAVLNYLHHRSPQFLQRSALCLLSAALLGLLVSRWMTPTHIPLLPMKVVLDPITLAPRNPGVGNSLTWLWTIYIAGVIALLLGWLIALARLVGLHLSARAVTDQQWQRQLAQHTRRQVRLYVSKDVASPMTWGSIWPVIVIPEKALRWSSRQVQWTLLHELSHIDNADWLCQQIGRLSSIFFWPIPCAWQLLATLCQEAEMAADNRVIDSGTAPPDYAAWLLQQAAGLRYRGGVALTPAGGLEQRFANLLHPRDDRNSAPLKAGWLLALIVLALPIAGLEVGVLTLPVVPHYGTPISRLTFPKPLPEPGTALIQRLSNPLHSQSIARPPAPPPVARAPTPPKSASP